MDNVKKNLQKFERLKYPLLVLVLGISLMLLPSSKPRDPDDRDEKFRQILQSSEGVGEARVIVSESGVVVVCRGAENAKVRLDIIKAVSSYTGYSSDKITVLKMTD